MAIFRPTLRGRYRKVALQYAIKIMIDRVTLTYNPLYHSIVMRSYRLRSKIEGIVNG